MEKVINDKNEMDDVAKTILDRLLHEAKNTHVPHATVLGLSGELGAGKTAFTQSFARVLGVRESISSPTFVIARFYDIPDTPPFRRLVHVDAYRIESEDELAPIGWSALLAEPTNLILVEWPEMLGKSFPSYGATLSFEVISETTRRIYDKKGTV